MKDKITVLTKGVVDAMCYGGMAVLVMLPLIIRLYGNYNSYFAENYFALVVLFFTSGIFSELILWELRRMLKTVISGDCFVQGNVDSLRRMGTYSFCIAAISAVRLLVYATAAVIVIIIVFLIAGLFSKVLAQVFDKAVQYKEENDLTV